MHQISIDSRPFRKGYPLGMHWISIDFRPFCKGVPLRNAADFRRLPFILQAVPP
jgi:hypothetical protein